jgi:soluble lytic murein transglycosylase-like protein
MDSGRLLLRLRTSGARRRPARLRLTLAAAAAILLIAVIAAALHRSRHPGLPLPGIGQPARAGDPFAYIPSREADFTSRALAGSAHVLFTKSPGGAVATAARVAAFRPLIDTAAAGTGIDPNLLEGIVFLESAGRPNVIAGTDPSAASGLTQILAQTGQSLLGMHVDLARSRRLTHAIGVAYAAGRADVAVRLERHRAQADDRFDPRKALAATIRYLRLAEQRFGRVDLAVVSYHMGIGNLQQVLADYNGGHAVPYAQLYFDTAPDHHGTAFNLLAGFGDDSSLYYWRILGSMQIMRLYRSDRSALARLAGLQLDTNSNAEVLHPPDVTPSFADPNALYSAYASHALLPLPSNATRLGLAYAAGLGSLAHRLGVPAALYRGLRVPALDLLIELAARVRSLSGGAAPLALASAVIDRRYEQRLPNSYPGATSGYSFQISRRYVSRAQASAFQSMLDRLQALNLIAWERTTTTIDVSVASDASRVLVDGP